MVAAAYAPALLVGGLTVVQLMPLAMLLGSGGLWSAPSGDVAQNLTGHLAFQAGAWGFPPLVAENLMPPHGISIAMTDSNPLMSLLAKLIHAGRPINLLGFWLAACWLLQPVAGVYALRGFDPAARWEAGIAAAILTATFPALLFRVGHINLCAHFILLAALGLAARRLHRLAWTDWLAPAVLLVLAILVHPYLFVFGAALLCAPWLQAVLDRRTDWRRACTGFALAAGLPVIFFQLMSGTLGGGAKGYGYYSMNLLSPIWPARSSLFGPDLALQDATGGQYEGYNYLGAGGLALLLLAAFLLRHRLRPGPWRGLILVLASLFLLSLSTRVYAGNDLMFSLGVRPWDQIFGPIQSTGRAFWPVGLALLLAGITTVSSRLPRAAAMLVLLIVCLLQWIDTARLRADAHAFYAGANPNPASLAIPPGATLLTTVPVCMASEPANNQAAALRLAAVRRGLRLADIRLSRPPPWFNCEKILSDGLELPLQPGEFRVFLDLPSLPPLRLAVLGPTTQCRAQRDLVACSDGIAPAAGVLPDPGPALPLIDLPVKLAGADLTPLLGIGWRQDDAGIPWSEGPRSTLLFRLPAGTARLRLTLAGISRRPGTARPIGLSVGMAAPRPIDLADQATTTLDIALTAGGEGIVRIAIDSDHPIPPHDRALQSPAKRASVRLLSLELAPG